jgi:FAD/FMN-containing dehydrogenase
MFAVGRRRSLLAAMRIGLALTVIAAVCPFGDRATAHLLAEHIRAGYPAYTQARVDSAVTTYLVLSSIIGALGVLAWLWTIRAVKAGKRWARTAATVMFLLGTSVGLTGLVTRDTSGDTGLPPTLGWVGMAPCLAGLLVVALLWRRPREQSAHDTSCGRNVMSSALQVLRRDFGGDIIDPDGAKYESASRSLLASGSPAFVLLPKSVGDVQAGVRFAAGAGLFLSVRGGGHSFSGFGTNDGGVVIDLGELANVEVIDDERHLVRIGGGATWGQVSAVLAPRGLAISSGDTKNVGVGGLTLSGGIGWKVRKYGLALDNLVAAEVVTANGEVVHASAEENPELFWGIRGGGGNLGIVTAFEFAAHPTTDVFHGKIVFPASEAATVLQGWAAHLRTAPEELTSIAAFANPFAGGPEAPVEIHVAFDGDDARLAARATDPIRRLGTVLGDDVALKPCADLLVDGAAPPPGIQIVTRSAFVDEDSVSEVLHILVEAGASEQSPIIAVRSVGGAVSRVPEDATAYAHRRAELMFVTTTAGPEPVVEAARPALEALWERLAPHVTGTYANFVDSATEEDVAAIYPRRTYHRLAAVKRRYDPGNLFADNHNVRPQ